MNFKKTYSALLVLYICTMHVLQAQIYDSFSSPWGTGPVHWEGDTLSFIVNSNNQLQLQADKAGTCYISTPYPFGYNAPMEWEMEVKMSFAPSANNYCRLYLQADTDMLTDTALSGYYLLIGENGSNDAIKLYYQHHHTHTMLASGTESAVASAFDIRIRVVTSASFDTLSIYTAPADRANWQHECTITDFKFLSHYYIGMLCTFTLSNSTKFIFDDIYHGPLRKDTLPPCLTSYESEPQDSIITLHFSEAVDTDMIDINNFYLSHIQPDMLHFNPQATDCYLHLPTCLQYNTNYTLYIYNVHDPAGNSMPDTVINLFYCRPHAFDILLHEIMPSPSPSLGLPETEYIELFNTRPYAMSLKNWTLKIGNNVKLLPDTIIPAFSYAIITAANTASWWQQYNRVIPVSGLQITDKGMNISLYDSSLLLIHAIGYTEEWYRDIMHNHGGIALEMADYRHPCGEENNWVPSAHAHGGTPGSANSVSYTNTDTISPYIHHIAVLTDTTIAVYFSEKIWHDGLNLPANYTLLPAGHITQVNYEEDIPQYIILTTYPSLDYNMEYTLFISDTLTDCVGNNFIMPCFCPFTRAYDADSNDVIINEILFNPTDNGVDFVEIYNTTNHAINMHHLQLATRNKQGDLTSIHNLTSIAQYLPAHTYALLSTNSSKVQEVYYCPHKEYFIQMKDFPAYANEQGDVVLLSNNKITDEFIYDAAMHYSMLTNVKGVSLERISPYAPTCQASNWHSAAASTGYATPGYKNSAFSSPNTIQDDVITLEPALFSPDNDGYHDILHIHYAFDQPGYRLSLYIYNENGILLRTLVNNEPVGTAGFYTWDGCIENGIKAGIGNYIVVASYWNTAGVHRKIRKTCALAIKK